MENGICGLAHIAVFTRDLGVSIDFYERLGGRLLQRGEAQKPKGVNQIVMMELADFQIELIEPHDGTEVRAQAGPVPHFALRVDDLEKTAAALRAAGVDTFQTLEPNVLPNLFGGLRNWYLAGPSGELIELMQPMA